MEQRLLPYRVPGHRIEIVQADQLALLEVVEQGRTIFGHFRQRQIDSQLSALLHPQAGSLQQMATADTGLPPEIDQLIGPARSRRTQPLDIAECGCIGARVEVGEGGVVAQTDAQGELDGFHGWLGGSAGAPAGSA